MPLFTVTMRAGKAAAEKNAISRAIHDASVKAGYPENDMFQRFLCLEPADLIVDPNYPGLPRPRTEKILMIEVLVSSGTDAEWKTRLLAALVESLDGAGTDPNDVMVFFGEIDRANSSFGGGRLAPPV
jgi:phenylpyruvate tautomerase PptA (4-oxalocrotonate tautomerase family)